MSDQYSGHRGQRATYTGTHINYKAMLEGIKVPFFCVLLNIEAPLLRFIVAHIYILPVDPIDQV